MSQGVLSVLDASLTTEVKPAGPHLSRKCISFTCKWRTSLTWFAVSDLALRVLLVY